MDEGALKNQIRELEERVEALQGDVERLRPQVEKAHQSIATCLMTLIDMQAPLISGHCKRVAGWARELGSAAGVSGMDLDELELAALLHDAGLLSIPLHRIQKAASIKALEEKMIRHPGIGYSLISRMEGLRKAADAILHHHERFDGSGYPHKLWGESIPFFSRLLAVADSYDNELYAKGGGLDAASPEEARRMLSRERGRSLDPELTNKFLYVLTTSEAMHRLDAREVEITPGALAPGMVLSRELRSVEKVLLLKSGTVLNDEIIDRLFSSDKSDWLVTQVYVDASSVRSDGLAVESRREERPRLLDAQPPSDIPAARRPEILVVDDSVAVCSALRRELGLAGMGVTGATSYPAAVEALKNQRFDAVISDLVISGSSGFEVLRMIRKQYPQLHCVVLSGFPTADNIRSLREFDNVVRFVTKPWAQDVLMAALREAVDRGRVRV